MRRDLAPYNFNFKRRGGENKPLLYTSGMVNDLGWSGAGTISFNQNWGIQLTSDGAYTQLLRVLPLSGLFSCKFTFCNNGYGSGADRCYLYWGDWYVSPSYYLNCYIRQYSSTDTYMAWFVKTNSHLAKTDAAVFYACEKYNWYNTRGTWYNVYFEITNKHFIGIKVWPYTSGGWFDGQGTWDYYGPMTNYGPGGLELKNGNLGIYSEYTGGNGFAVFNYGIEDLGNRG